MSPSRRQYLGGVLSATSLAVAGCSSGGGSDGDGEAGPGDAPAEFQLDGVTLNTNTPVRLADGASGEMLVRIHGHGDTTHWHRSPLVLQVGQWREFEIVFRDFEGEQIPLGESEQFQAAVSLPDEVDFVEVDHSGTQLNLRGTETGSAQLSVELHRDGQPQWRPPTLSVDVRG